MSSNKTGETSEVPEEEKEKEEEDQSFWSDSRLVYPPDILLIPLAGFTAASFLGSMHWLFELTTHFRVQYGIGALLIGTIYLFFKKYVRAGLLAAVFLLNATMIVPLYLPPDHADTQSKSGMSSVKLMSINVSTSNRNAKDVLQLVREKQPDLILLMEVNRWWIKALKPLNKQYPHHRAAPRSDNFGIALYTKKQVDDIKVRTPTRYNLPVITARFRHADTPVQFTGVHTLPPVSPSYFVQRNALLSRLANTVAVQSNPSIVMGDLNTTSWSPYFQSFIETAGLRDTRKGFGVQPTWPSFFHIAPLQICLDHCLVSDDLKVMNRTVLRDIGSDHYPILVSLRTRDDRS